MTPSQRPIRAATAGFRRPEVKSSSAGAGGRRDAARRTGSRIVIDPSVSGQRRAHLHEPWPSIRLRASRQEHRFAASGSPRHSRAKRVVGASAATAVASTTVSTSHSTAAWATRNPEATSARSVSRQVVPVDIGTSTSTSPRVPSASASTHQPPSSAGPSTAGRWPSRADDVLEEGGGDLGRVHPDLHDGPGPVAATSACALASRSPSPRPRCWCTVHVASRSADLLGPARPRRGPRSSRRAACPGPNTTSKTSRVSRSAAAASRAATSSPTSAPSRVLTCPPTGALATTSTRAGALGPEQRLGVVTGSPARSHGPRAGCL